MSASERLREKFEEAFSWDNTDYWGHVTPAAQIKAALPEIIALVEAAEAGALSLNYAESHGHSPYDGNLDKEELFEGVLKDVRVALVALDAKLTGTQEGSG